MLIRPFAHGELEALVRLWNETKRHTYTFIELERNRSVDEDRGFFLARILPRCKVWIAAEDDMLRGFLALAGSYVDRLYVKPDAQRRGVGSALLRKAMVLSPKGLELHTHQKNEKACAFYAKHGFTVARYGVSPPPESEPDVELHWRRR